MGLLSLAIWTPIAFGAVLLALGRDDQARVVRWFALIGAVASLLVTLPLYTGFDASTAAMQFVEKAPWIERFNVNYHLGLDGISFWFVPLTAFITVIVVISAWEAITERVNQYMGAFSIASVAANTPIIRPDRIRNAPMYWFTRSVMASQAEITTITVMNAVSSTNRPMIMASA